MHSLPHKNTFLHYYILIRFNNLFKACFIKKKTRHQIFSHRRSIKYIFQCLYPYRSKTQFNTSHCKYLSSVRITKNDGFGLLKMSIFFKPIFVITDMTVCTTISPPSINILNHIYVGNHCHGRFFGNVFLRVRITFSESTK